jgi:hypothetical protein
MEVEPDREPATTEPADAEPPTTETAARDTDLADSVTPAAGGATDQPAAEGTGEPAEAPAAEPAPARRLRPGDVPETRVALWGNAGPEADDFRERIREAGNLFVDDPHFAVTASATVVTDAVNALARALERQQAELDPRHGSDQPDTESLRVAVRRYRELLDRVLAL